MPKTFEAYSGAITVPYRISSAGRFIVDVSVNGNPPVPFSLDTGATISVLYDEYAKSIDLKQGDQIAFVRGLVATGERPIVDDVHLAIGSSGLGVDRVVLLETPKVKDEAVGLLSNDVLSQRAVLFDQKAGLATFLRKESLARQWFKGWRRIPVSQRKDSPDTRLFFSHTRLKSIKVPVLIDFGSNLNFVNWKLATMDEEIRAIERELIGRGELQGALETTRLTKRTTFHDLQIGDQSWRQTEVVIMELDNLSNAAPVDQAMMIAGSSLFTPLTFALNLGGNMIYVWPESDGVPSPKNN